DVTPRRPVDSVEREPAPAEGPATVSNGDVSLALVETSSGLTLPNGALVALVSAKPEESAALVDRLGRFGPDRAGFETVRLHGIPLLSWSLREVRSRVLVSETDPRLFTGTLRSELDPWGTHTDTEILTALDVASGADILDALPDGLDSEVEERGRSLSGGQRQRLTLTRALLADAEILILVEPTSAVDAHTEARIAGRLAEYRRGRTTLVVSASPLMLAAADDVAFLHDGVVTARGRHHDLLRSDPAYRAVVVRGEDS
nr:ABC transporter ATP-binding protein [Dermatophilaceae bacterium]